MKKILLMSLIALTRMYALPYELFKVHDGNNFVVFPIDVYHDGQFYAEGWTLNYDNYNQYGPANGAGQIYPHNDSGTFTPIQPRSGTWQIVIGLKYFELALDNYQSGDLYIDYNVLTHACSITVKAAPGPPYSGPYAVADKYEIMLTNDFAESSTGSGYFGYDGITNSNSSYKRLFKWSSSSEFPHTVSAKSGLNQIYNGIPRMYNNWTGFANTYDPAFSIPNPTNVQAQANFNPGYKTTFKNSFGSSSTNGIIRLDSRTYNSPADTAIRQGYPINATAVNQNKSIAGTNNYIELTLDHWSTGSTSQTITVTPGSNNQVYYCYLKGKPVHYAKHTMSKDVLFINRCITICPYAS